MSGGVAILLALVGLLLIVLGVRGTYADAGGVLLAPGKGKEVAVSGGPDTSVAFGEPRPASSMGRK